jgi:predicted RNA binding protein YcfA (HicA-like mRNA interferase family)
VKQVTGKELAKALEKKGWSLSRIKGSHHVYLKEGHRERIVVPIHGNKPLKIGLLKAQMKTAGLTENEL